MGAIFRRGAGWLLAWGVLPAVAAGPDPLSLVPAPVAEDGPALWGGRLELWREQSAWAAGDGQTRAVLDFRHAWSLAQGLRLGLSSRLEHVSAGGGQSRHALRELWVSVPVAEGVFADLGRLNWRNGVALGFNPTDYLRRGTQLEQGTQDPRALRENRLGTVMWRQQWLGRGGSAQLALIPDLGAADRTRSADPAWGRSNPVRAALLKLSPQLDERSSLDLLAYARAGQGPQFGVNLTYLSGDALVWHLEASQGRRAVPDDPAGRRRSDLAVGANWSSPFGPVIGLEWQREAERGSRALFARMAWDDVAGHDGLDLAAFVRHDLVGHGRAWQFDVDWQAGSRHGLALFVGGQAGQGGQAPRRYAGIGWRGYF